MTGTMHTPDSARLPVRGIWTIRERDPRTGLVVATKTVHNVLTNFGLSALASATSGSYSPPLWLVIDNFTTTPAVAINIGDTSVQLTSRVDVAGDTQLVLSVGGALQETVTYNAVSGSGPYTYTLTAPTVHAHPTTDLVCRNVAVVDTMTTTQNEQQFDPVNFPGQRTQSPGGYSAGIGNWVVQFYMSGGISLQSFIICGLSDSMYIGQGNLHNHFVLGYNRQGSTNDIEIDGSITIANA